MYKRTFKIKTDLEFGQTLYLKSDPYQHEYKLVRVIVDPPNQIKMGLSFLGEIAEVFDFEISTERDDLKYMEAKDCED